jgi:hypothetical protein
MSTSPQYPTLVMIIRHGEKPGDPSNDDDGGPSLSTLGSARAAALPSLFTPDPTATPGNDTQLTCDLTVGAESEFSGAYSSSGINAGQSRFATPDFLFATAQGSSTSSNRPVETITPLAQALQFFNNPKITINDSFTNNTSGIDGLTSTILNNSGTYGGQVILICWHHGAIPQLTEAFAVPSSQLPFTKWPGTVFDLIFSITWDSSGQANLVVDYQLLLYGDTTTTGQSS